jgi:hypothetical protein
MGFAQCLTVFTDVSGQPIGPVFKGQTVLHLVLLYLEEGTDSLSRNVGNKIPFYVM